MTYPELEQYVADLTASVERRTAAKDSLLMELDAATVAVRKLAAQTRRLGQIGNRLDGQADDAEPRRH